MPESKGMYSVKKGFVKARLAIKNAVENQLERALRGKVKRMYDKMEADLQETLKKHGTKEEKSYYEILKNNLNNISENYIKMVENLISSFFNKYLCNFLVATAKEIVYSHDLSALRS